MTHTRTRTVEPAGSATLYGIEVGRSRGVKVGHSRGVEVGHSRGVEIGYRGIEIG